MNKNTHSQQWPESFLDWVRQGRTAWWLYVIGAVLSIAMVVALKDFLALPFKLLLAPAATSEPAQLITKTLGFVFVWLFPPLYVRIVHKRPAWSVALPRPMFEGANMALGFVGAGLTLLCTYALFALLAGIKLTLAAVNLQDYVPYLLAAIVAFLVQTSAEELTFRGYIMQALRRFMSNPVLIILLTGIIFALPHLPNLAGMKLPDYAVLLYVIDGCLLAWLAVRTRSLWMPIGWHFGNNLMLSTLIGVRDVGDVVQAHTLIVADRAPEAVVWIAIKALASLLVLAGLVWVIRRREASAGR